MLVGYSQNLCNDGSRAKGKSPGYRKVQAVSSRKIPAARKYKALRRAP